MRITLLCHSLVSDWNHGNAHFLRGVVRELQRAGHELDVLEPAGGWSRENLLRAAGEEAAQEFHACFPTLRSRTYDRDTFDPVRELEDAELVIVHDWIEPELVAAIGAERRRRGDFLLLFYDAHHRALTAPEQVAAFDLRGYDAVLAFGSVIRDEYLRRGWVQRAYLWHEAADTELFAPRAAGASPNAKGDLVWIGNWGDEERTAELDEFLFAPARRLGLSGTIHGVRYPASARRAVGEAGLRYRGWLPNHRAPDVFARHRLTVHVPRRAYARRIPGVPTIRVFEALACGIPLISAPWQDTEELFRAGRDLLMVKDGGSMASAMRRVLSEPELAASLARSGLETIRARHTCAHRARELMAIVAELRSTVPAEAIG